MIVIDSTGMVVGTTRVNCPLPNVRTPREHIEIKGMLYGVAVVRAPSAKGTAAIELAALMLPVGGDPSRLPGWQPAPKLV